MSNKEYFRMFQWLLLAAFFYTAAVLVQQPQIETGLWKAGHITSGAFLGYWIDRHLFGRYDHNDSYTNRILARALIVGAAVLGMAFGL